MTRIGGMLRLYFLPVFLCAASVPIAAAQTDDKTGARLPDPATREASLERSLEREDVGRTTRLLATSAKRILDMKAAYLALPAAAPARLELGLQRMRERFVQGINEADLKLRRAALERMTASKTGRGGPSLQRSWQLTPSLCQSVRRNQRPILWG